MILNVHTLTLELEELSQGLDVAIEEGNTRLLEVINNDLYDLYRTIQKMAIEEDEYNSYLQGCSEGTEEQPGLELGDDTMPPWASR